MEIIKARIEDIDSYLSHNERLFDTNGQNGVLFSPREAGTFKKSIQDFEQVKNRWSKEENELGHEMMWLLMENDKVIGHAGLRQCSLESSMHRRHLLLGIDSEYRYQGWGQKLLKLAIDWAKENQLIEWIDLSVFEGNNAALKIYKSFGFIETGRNIDAFRLYEQKVTNINMTLKLS